MQTLRTEQEDEGFQDLSAGSYEELDLAIPQVKKGSVFARPQYPSGSCPLKELPIFAQMTPDTIGQAKGSSQLYSFNSLEDCILVYNRLENFYTGNHENSIQIRTTSKQRGCRSLGLRLWKPPCKSSEHLSFDSRFESGNLLYAMQCKTYPNNYLLFMANDSNSAGYSQWFYFAVSGMVKGQTYSFTVANFRKKHSLFGKGMRPLVFSFEASKAAKESAWSYVGGSTSYNGCPLSPQPGKFYALSFTYCADYDDDLLTFCSGLPYTLSKQLIFIEQLLKRPSLKKVEVREIARSIANNSVHSISITSHYGLKKGTILFTARQHPGQTWSSYLAESLINAAINSQDVDISELLTNYSIVFYPMLNPDGVVLGNYRCDCTGSDLNRSWEQPFMQPQIEAIKADVLAIHKENPIECYFDLHGHSKNHNIFIYSTQQDQNSCRILPFMLSQAFNQFSFENCTYGLHRSKQKTARGVISKLIDSKKSYTIECSAHGSKSPNSKAVEFTPRILDGVAVAFLKTLLQFVKPSRLFDHAKQTVIDNLPIYRRISQLNKEQDGSDSEPEADLIPLSKRLKGMLSNRAKPTKPSKQSKRHENIKLDPRANSEMEGAKTKQIAAQISNLSAKSKVKERKPTLNLLSPPKNQNLRKSESLGNQYIYKQGEKAIESWNHSSSALQEVKLLVKPAKLIDEASLVLPNMDKGYRVRKNASYYFELAQQTRLERPVNSISRLSKMRLSTLQQDPILDKIEVLFVLAEKRRHQIEQLKTHKQPLIKKRISAEPRHKTKKFETPVPKPKMDHSMDLIAAWRQNVSRYGKNL